MSNTLDYIWSTIPTSRIFPFNKERAQKEFFCVTSRVCDESRIPFLDLPTAAAAGPSSDNWPSEPCSKLSTLASFRHLRLQLLLVFSRVIYIKQNKLLIYLDLMHCQWWTRVETWRVTKCQMPHSCFARVPECSAVETQELYVPITHSLLLFDLALPSSSASTARNIRYIYAVRAPFI